ncbi:MAG: lipid A export permease/ATP-binding protein MsbA [Steroidobacteraceae bacterium]
MRQSANKQKSEQNLPPLSVSGMQIYRRLLGYARPHRAMFLLGVLGMILFAACDWAFPWLAKVFLDGAFTERDSRVLALVPAGIVVLFSIRGIGDYLAVFAMGSVGRQIIKAMRRDLFARYLELPTAFFDRHGAGPLLSRLTYNIELVAEAATTAVTSLIRDTLTIVGLLGVLLWLNWKLTVFALVVAPLIIGLIRVTSRLLRRYSMRIQSSMGDVTRVAKESLESLRMVKVFNAERQQLGAFERVNERNRASYMKLIAVRAVSNPVVQLIAALGLAAVMYVAIRDVLADRLTVGEFTAFLAALLLITAPLRRLVNVVSPLQQGVAAGESVFEILDTPAEDAGGDLRISRARGELEFRDVGFTYEAEKGEVLRDIRFHAAPGQTIAIVGRSGSGKSTLVSLLPRLHDPDAGAVLLDGRNLRDYRLEDLRRQISVVSQEIMLLDDSIRNNIAFGMPEADAAAVEQAAQAAHVLDFARELPGGLNAMVGERGTLLSGGQRQRVAIARALLKDAPVLILDEAMSALDSESERAVQDALARLLRDRTTLVIAHRLSTIERADRIIVLDEGRIVESGTHAELRSAGGVYAALHRMQFNV